YEALHRLGFAHSVEAWADGELCGGFYGVSLGAAFFGESMFARRTDASKVVVATLLGNLDAWGFSFLDCQVPNPHLMSLGAECWPRCEFLRALKGAVAAPTRRGPWTLELDAVAAAERIP